MYCPTCGAEVGEESRYCPDCGAAVDGDPATGEQQPAEGKQPPRNRPGPDSEDPVHPGQSTGGEPGDVADEQSEQPVQPHGDRREQPTQRRAEQPNPREGQRSQPTQPRGDQRHGAQGGQPGQPPRHQPMNDRAGQHGEPQPAREPAGQRPPPAQQPRDQRTAQGRTERPAADSTGNDGLTFPPVLPWAGLWHGLRAFVSGYLLIAGVLIVELVLAVSDAAGAGAPPTAPSSTPGVGEDTLATFAAMGAGTAIEAIQSPVMAVVKMVGWLFYNAHNVAIEGSLVAGEQTAGGSVNMLALAGQLTYSPITPIIYYVIPPVLLLFAGRRITKERTVAESQAALAAGAQVAIGYVLLLAIGSIFVTVSASANAGGLGAGAASVASSAGPGLGMTIVMGLLYSGIFGAIGGFWGS